MIQPIPKPKKATKRNRGSHEYHTRKAAYLAEREQWPPGWWICDGCGVWTQEPELDHIENTAMGGSPERLMDENNWQLLCRKCHDDKTNNRKQTEQENY